MNEALLRKRYGVPALALMGILLTAGIAAAFVVASFQYTAPAAEPPRLDKTDEPDIAYPGDVDNINVEVSNNNTNLGYGIVERVENIPYSADNLDGVRKKF